MVLRNKNLVSQAEDDISETLINGGSLRDIGVRAIIIATSGEQVQAVEDLTREIRRLAVARDAHRGAALAGWGATGLRLPLQGAGVRRGCRRRRARAGCG